MDGRSIAVPGAETGTRGVEPVASEPRMGAAGLRGPGFSGPGFSATTLAGPGVLPFGFAAVKPALELMSSYALEMKIIPRRYTVEELFDDTTLAL